jgi:putative redox protein
LREAQVERAVTLSAEKYCSASIMFTNAGVTVTHSHSIEEAAAPS